MDTMDPWAFLDITLELNETTFHLYFLVEGSSDVWLCRCKNITGDCLANTELVSDRLLSHFCKLYLGSTLAVSQSMFSSEETADYSTLLMCFYGRTFWFSHFHQVNMWKKRLELLVNFPKVWPSGSILQSITLLVILGTRSNYINEIQFTVSCSFPLGVSEIVNQSLFSQKEFFQA